MRGYLHFRIAKNIAPSSDKALAVMRRCIFLTGLSSPGKPLEGGDPKKGSRSDCYSPSIREGSNMDFDMDFVNLGTDFMWPR